MYTITRKSSSRRQSANSMDSSDQLMKDETNHGSNSVVSSEEEESDDADESGSDSGTSTVTCTSLHSRGGISSGSGLTSSSGSSGWSSAGQAVYSPMKLTKRWRKTHEAEAENKLQFLNQGTEMAIEPSDQEDEEAESTSSYNALDLSCYGHGMDYCSDSRSLEVVANWLDRNHHHAMRSGGPLSPPTTPPTFTADNESLSSINRLTGEQHLNGMGFLVQSPSVSDSSNFLSSRKQQLMDPSTQVMTPKSSPCCSPNNGIKNSQGQIEFRSFGSLSTPSTSCSSPSSSNYHHLNNNCYPAATASMMPSRPLFPSSSSLTMAAGMHQLSGSMIENGSDQFSCLYLLASAAVSELERQRQFQKHQSQAPSQNPAATNNTSTVVQTLTVVS